MTQISEYDVVFRQGLGLRDFGRVSGGMNVAVGFNPRNVDQNDFAASAAIEQNAKISRR